MMNRLKEKKTMIILGIIAVILLAVIFIVVGQGGSTSAAEQLSLGDRFLTEMNYEKAIIAFEKVLTIDPKNVEAYLRLAKAYINMGNTDGAIAVLERGFNETGDSAIKVELDKLKADKEGSTQQAEPPTDESNAQEETVTENSAVNPVAPIKVVKKIEPLSDDVFDYAQEFKNGYAFAMKGNDVGYVDKNGVFTVQYTLPQDEADSMYYTMAYSIKAKYDHSMNVSEEGIFPFYDADRDTWGYKNIHTDLIVVEPQYVSVNPFMDGRAVARYKTDNENFNGWNSTAKYAILDVHGDIVFEASEVFDRTYTSGLLGIQPVGALNEEDGCYVDKNGKVVIDKIQEMYGGIFLPNGSFIAFDSSKQLPREGGCFVICQKSAQTLYYTAQGQLIRTREPKYIFLRPQNGFTAYYGSPDEELMGLETMDGKQQVTKPIYKKMSFVFDGVAWVQGQNDLFGLIDTTGKEIIPCKYLSVTARPNEGYLSVQDAETKRWGIINYSDEVIIPFEYNWMGFVSGGVSTYKENDKYGYINIRGEKLTDAIYDRPCSMEEETFLVETGTKQVRGLIPGELSKEYRFLKASEVES